MRLHTLIPLALLALTAPRGANAQSTPSGIEDAPVGFREATDTAPVQHFLFNVGGGVSFPISDAAGRFQTGGGFQVGLGYQLLQRLGVTAEYLFTGYDVQSNVLTGATDLDGNHAMHYGTLNAVVDVLPNTRFGFYIIGGPGVYYRRVEITQFAGTAAVPYCDPWLYVCYTSVVPVSEILGARDSTDFGLNAGLGFTFSLSGDLRLYLEGRYHYIFGPQFTDVDGAKRNANGQYIPVMFGIRY